jgi:dienelactone hydrolase
VSLLEDAEAEAIKGPLSLACAEVDEIFPPEKRAKTEAILAKTKQPYESRVFGGTNHGFAVRGDMSDPKQKYAKEAAFTQATLWFDEFLKA